MESKPTRWRWCCCIITRTSNFGLTLKITRFSNDPNWCGGGDFHTIQGKGLCIHHHRQMQGRGMTDCDTYPVLPSSNFDWDNSIFLLAVGAGFARTQTHQKLEGVQDSKLGHEVCIITMYNHGQEQCDVRYCMCEACKREVHMLAVVETCQCRLRMVSSGGRHLLFFSALLQITDISVIKSHLCDPNPSRNVRVALTWKSSEKVSRSNSCKNRRTGKSSLHAHLGIIILLCAKFRPNPSRNVGGLALTRTNCEQV
jgi:hypothetical protein